VEVPSVNLAEVRLEVTSGQPVQQWRVTPNIAGREEGQNMRAILLILILAVVALIAAIGTGLIDVSQTRGARAPTVAASDGTIRAQGGQSPAFEVQTGSVEVGTRDANIAVPRIEVKRDEQGVKVPTVEIRPPEEANQNAAR